MPFGKWGWIVHNINQRKSYENSSIFYYILLSFFAWFAQAEKLSLQLDWFVNPDHAALIVAQQKGFFAKNGIEVEIIEPADPSMPPKLVAAGKSDLAVGYQPQLYLDVDQSLPLVRIATLIATPLNSIVALKESNIKTLADLKAKKSVIRSVVLKRFYSAQC